MPQRHFDEVKVFAPRVFADERGWFKEVYAQARYREDGVDETFVQDNVSLSRKGVLRGLHYDLRMSKLVQCLRGRIYDVVVDLRAGSNTNGDWDAVELSGDNHRQVFVPAGFAHGFYTLSDEAIVLYKQTAGYDPRHERAIAWNDARIGIPWPLDGEPVLSAKDAAL